MPACRFQSLLLTTVLFWGAGCVGGQTGSEGVPRAEGGATSTKGEDDSANGETGGDLGTGVGPEDVCQEPFVEVGLEDDTALGFQASELLDFALAPYESSLAWNQDSGLVGIGPEGKTGIIKVQLLAAATSARVVSPKDSALCGEPRLELDAMVSISTEGGALDETLPVTLVARSPSSVEFSATLNPQALHGKLRLDLPTGVSLLTYSLNCVLTPDDTTGSLTAQIEEVSGKEPGTVSSTILILARWPTLETEPAGSP